MTFDVSTLSTLDQSNQGSFLAFTDPKTGAPVRDADKKEVGVTLRGRLSTAAINLQRNLMTRRLEVGRRGQDTSLESIEEEGTDMLVACTVSWTFDVLDGKPFPFSPENARKFWSDDRFRRFREQANLFIGNEANFTKR
jgi:hypothetical protein